MSASHTSSDSDDDDDDDDDGDMVLLFFCLRSMPCTAHSKVELPKQKGAIGAHPRQLDTIAISKNLTSRELLYGWPTQDSLERVRGKLSARRRVLAPPPSLFQFLSFSFSPFLYMLHLM